LVFGTAGMVRMKPLASVQKREASRAGLVVAADPAAAGAAEDPHPHSSRRPAKPAAAAAA
jgi:hypothetical protein